MSCPGPSIKIQKDVSDLGNSNVFRWKNTYTHGALSILNFALIFHSVSGFGIPNPLHFRNSESYKPQSSALSLSVEGQRLGLMN